MMNQLIFKKKIKKWFLLRSLILFNIANAESSIDWEFKSRPEVTEAYAKKIESDDILQFTNEPLFVSLGSNCGPAVMMYFCDIRRAAFPLDGIYSMDGEKVIELLEDSFSRFIDEQFMDIYREYPINTYYHLQFVHENGWNDANHSEKLLNFKETFTRRIKRFKKLNAYPGKVYFFRSAFAQINDPYAVTGWFFPDNVEISDEYALRLMHTLEKIFPNLDFSLIIINHSDRGHLEIEKSIGRILKVRTLTFPLATFEAMSPFYMKLFRSLIEGSIETEPR